METKIFIATIIYEVLIRIIKTRKDLTLTGATNRVFDFIVKNRLK